MTDNLVVSPLLNVTFSALHAGTLILDSNLTVDGVSYTARAFMRITPGATDPRQLLVTGPGALGGLALQPTTFYATAHNLRGDPSVCVLASPLPSWVSQIETLSMDPCVDTMILHEE